MERFFLEITSTVTNTKKNVNEKVVEYEMSWCASIYDLWQDEILLTNFIIRDKGWRLNFIFK